MNARAVLEFARSPVFLSIFLVCLGCTSSTESIESDASDLGMAAFSVQGDPFNHRVFELAARDESSAPVKLILIDGDGRAFIDQMTVARDPTPLHSSLLALAPELVDQGHVIYLGRPCYHRLQDPECNPLHWTLERYGQSIITSSVRAARQLIEPGDQVFLLGYSGGGVIAMLMARKMHPEIAGVVTYGSPLDTDAWTAFHGYTDLILSENPARDPDSFNDFCQIHLFGNRDRIIPEKLVTSWTWRSPQKLSVISSDHFCCWQPAVLDAIQNLVETCQTEP